MLAMLILLPVFAAVFAVVFRSDIMHYFLAAGVLALSGTVAGVLYFSADIISVHLPFATDILIVMADVVLLLYFLYQGIKFKNTKIMLLAVVQMVLYGWAEANSPSAGAAEIIVDDLSKFMFWIINVVGGIIVLYSIRYMASEGGDPLKKRFFIAGLFLFLAVMNAIVCADSILLFFFLFELTTLASYLLIAFRNDEISRTNALRALWMNQIGGVVILAGALIAIGVYGTPGFDELIHSSGSYVLLGVGLLSMAALIKGASIPFDGWLLGAMVAPTPVSAMLHSATMVKIAPFLILKFSPALGDNPVGILLSIIGSLTFVAASYLALSRSVFKEILGYSTVALLGLMIALAAIATHESIELAMVLMLFHALSKALLFLAAGVLEKQHHVKNVEEMKGMIQRAPRTVGYVLFGFMSLTLPPFGLFMGKLFAIVSVASLLREHPWLLIVMVAIIVGSTLLVLLYYKVTSALFSRDSDTVCCSDERMGYGFEIPLIMLSLLIAVGAAGFLVFHPERLEGWMALPVILVALLPLIERRMDRFDRTGPYHCGEKETFDAALVYFEPSLRIREMIYWGLGMLFVGVAVAGAVS